jgi:predicted amidophosphoribosyltransferase
MTLTTLVSTALAEAWALVAPVDCAGCGAHDRAMCPSCATGLQSRLMRATLEVDGSSLPIVAALPYAGVARRALLALKHEGRTELARSLAPVLLAAVTVAWHGSGAELLVPVPGSPAAAARRGFGPVALMARRAGLAVTHALRPVSAAPEQKGLRLEQRLATDAGRWRASSRVSGHRVLLVDDVVTSGGTLRAATRALRAAGAEVAGCAAMAAAVRRWGESSIHWKFIARHDEGHGDNEPVEDYREGKEA